MSKIRSLFFLGLLMLILMGQTILAATPGKAVKGTAVEAAQKEGNTFATGCFYDHVLVINNDEEIVATRNDLPVEFNIPSRAKTNVHAVAAGSYHALCLKVYGEVMAWGNNEFRQCNVPIGAQSGVVAIAAGNYHSLALKVNGEVIAWGNNDHGQCKVPEVAQKDIVAIAADGYDSLALNASGELICWHNNRWEIIRISDLDPINITLIIGQKEIELNGVKRPMEVPHILSAIKD